MADSKQKAFFFFLNSLALNIMDTKTYANETNSCDKLSVEHS